MRLQKSLTPKENASVGILELQVAGRDIIGNGESHNMIVSFFWWYPAPGFADHNRQFGLMLNLLGLRGQVYRSAVGDDR